MGATVGYLAAGALLGYGIASMGRSSSAPYAGSTANYHYDNLISSAPGSVEAPVIMTDDGAQKSETMLAAEEEERQRLAAQKEANRTNYTSGLGVSSQANVGLKTLLG